MPEELEEQHSSASGAGRLRMQQANQEAASCNVPHALAVIRPANGGEEVAEALTEGGWLQGGVVQGELQAAVPPLPAPALPTQPAAVGQPSSHCAMGETENDPTAVHVRSSDLIEFGAAASLAQDDKDCPIQHAKGIFEGPKGRPPKLSLPASLASHQAGGGGQEAGGWEGAEEAEAEAEEEPEGMRTPASGTSWISNENLPHTKLPSANWKDIFETEYLRQVVDGPHYLDLKMRYKFEALCREKHWTSLFVISSLPAAMSSMLGIFCVALAFLRWVLDCVWISEVVFHQEWSSFRNLKFTALELRGGQEGTAISGPGIQELGFLYKDCRHNISHSPLLFDGPSATLEFNDTAATSGWWFRTGLGPKELDPVRFVVEGSNDGENWEVIGASGSTTGLDGTMLFRTHARFPTTRWRESKVEFDMSVRWPWILGVLILSLQMTAGLALGLIFAWWGRLSAAAKSVGASFLIGCLLMFLAALIELGTGHGVSGVLWLGRGAGMGFMAWAILLDWAPIFNRLIPIGLYHLAMGGLEMYVEELTWFDNPRIFRTFQFGLSFTFFGLLIPILKEFMVRKTRAALVKHELGYNQQWNAVKESEEASELLVLCRLLKPYSVDSMTSLVGYSLNIKNCPYLQTFRSLDQAFAQARGINPFLQAKVRQWAEATKGLMPSNVQNMRATESSLGSFQSLLHVSVVWADLKTPERAMEKALRVYGGDIRRCLDLARQTIVFRTVRDIVECVKQLIQDDQIRIVRVKNRLDVTADTEESGGHRSVVINMRIVSAESKRLALASHIVELCLILKPFWQQQMQYAEQGGHLAYIQYRNLRHYRHSRLYNLLSILSPGGQRSLGMSRKGAVEVIVERDTGEFHVQPLMPEEEIEQEGQPQDASLIRKSSILALMHTGSNEFVWAKSSEAVSDTEQPPMEDQRALIQGEWRASSHSLQPVLSAERQHALNQVLEQQFVLTTQGKRGELDRKMKGMVQASMRHASVSSALFTAIPVTAALCKPGVRIFSMVIGLAYVFFVLNLVLTQAEWASAVQYYKLTVLELRGKPMTECQEVQPFKFGLLWDDCPVIAPVNPVQLDKECATVLHFDHPLKANGWYFETSLQQSPAYDPSRFVVERSKDLKTWEQIGSSSWRSDFYGTGFNRNFFDDGPFEMPLGRSLTVHFDMQPERHWFWVPLLHDLLAATLFLCILPLSTRFHKEHLATDLFAATFFITGTFLLAATLVDIDRMNANQILIHLLRFIPEYLLVLGTRPYEKHFIHFCFWSGIANGLGFVLFQVEYHRFSSSKFITTSFLLLFWLVITLHRKYILGNSTKMIDDHQQRYTRAWEAVLQQGPAVLQQLEEIKSFCEVAQQDTPEVPRQFERTGSDKDVLQASFAKRLSRRRLSALHKLAKVHQSPTSSSSGINRDLPLRSLDQVYAQAAGLDPFLKAKVKEWAADSEGLFETFSKSESIRSNSSVLLNWREAMDHEILGHSSVKWADTKKPDRAIEKLFRSYGGDVSRLTDICRQSLVFHRVSDLHRAVMRIKCDSEIKVERVKNRLEQQYQGLETGGFRNVAFNLRIVTPLTQKLHLDAHVCEVQLVLQNFHHLKTEEGHKCYVHYRNLRAE